MQAYRNWLLDEESHVATLSLNRPESGNNLNTETLNELRDACEALRTKSDIWAIILRSNGDHFSTGFDPELIRSGFGESEDSIRETIAGHQECLAALESIGKPTIAVLRGFCIGGGLILALCCDFRIAGTRTMLYLPEVKLGIPVLWGTHRIVRVTGAASAKKLIMLGDKFRAAEALAWGLVHEVVPEEKLDATADALVAKLMKIPPKTLTIAKRLIDDSAGRMSIGTEAMELEAISELRASPDLFEALDSYLEKRLPVYRGE